ncbi:MAG TPA: hypothetical protein VJG83_01430 [archaeon]|nr:hypothetical protein [archaeon]
MMETKNMNFILVLFLSALFAGTAFAFTVSGGTFDGNFFETPLDVADGNVSGGTYSGDFILPETVTGQVSGGVYSGQLGVYFDANRPVVTISSPASGASVESSSVTVEYSGSSLGNPITRYFLRLDSGSWIDNGLATNYTFTGFDYGSHTISIIAMDTFDINSSTASVTFTFPQPAAAASTSTPTLIGSIFYGLGGSIVVNTMVSPEQLSTDRIQDTALNKLEGDSAKEVQQEETRLAVQNEVLLTRQVSGRLSQNGVDLAFVLIAKNVSGKDLEGVKVIEYIPKEVASTASIVVFKPEPTKILLDDPVVLWEVGPMKDGEHSRFEYRVEREAMANDYMLNDEFFQNQPTATAILRDEMLSCSTVICTDNNPCTRDYCSQGRCYFSSLNNVSCGDGLTCKSGYCAPEKTTSQGQVPLLGTDLSKQENQLPIFLLAIVAAIALIFALTHGRSKIFGKK